MLDISVAYSRYQFLGHEFLTWMWYTIEKNPRFFTQADPDLMSLTIGNRVVLENRLRDNLEIISIKGDDAGLEEGILALRKGAVVAEINLVYKTAELEWRFSLKGENLSITGLKTPETGKVENKEDFEGAVLEKQYLYDKIIQFIDAVFGQFIRLRISKQWTETSVKQIREWITTK